jgi:hypothetical protein
MLCDLELSDPEKQVFWPLIKKLKGIAPDVRSRLRPYRDDDPMDSATR